MQLDIDMVNYILEDGLIYQNFEKAIFIQKLGEVFNEFIDEGDTFLNCHKGFCNNELCNYQCSGFTFIGNNSNNYIALTIEIEKSIIRDIYEYKIFKTLDAVNEKGHRVQIDKLDMLLFPHFRIILF